VALPIRTVSAAPTVDLVQTRHVDGVTIRVLRNGDVAPIAALLARLEIAPPELARLELTELARVDNEHHVLIAYDDVDPRPSGIARLVRDGSSADVSLAVADGRNSHRRAAALTRALAADARAAGIREITGSWSAAGRTRPVSVLERFRRYQGRFAGGAAPLNVGR
jgi:hypothetical protein